jgi:hypothetical protein
VKRYYLGYGDLQVFGGDKGDTRGPVLQCIDGKKSKIIIVDDFVKFCIVLNCLYVAVYYALAHGHIERRTMR